MPEHTHTTGKKRGHTYTKVTMRRGETIALCRCWQSGKFPLCDGSHKTIQDEKGPVLVRTDCESDFITKPGS